MQETRKRQHAVGADEAAAGGEPRESQNSPMTTETTESALETLARRIEQDAGDDAVTYLVRSNTGHDGE